MKKILESEWPVVVYESKHRIIKFLEELKKLNYESGIMNYGEYSDNQGDKRGNEKIKNKRLTSVVVCSELSKMHETIYRGDLDSIMEKIKNDKNAQKGEFTVIVGK